MSGRYLVIEFDDAKSASSLRAQIDAASQKGRPFRVIGLFAKPDPPFCGCGTEISDRGRVSTLKRGKKFGWLICTTCKLPSQSGLGYLSNLVKYHDIINPPVYETKSNGKYPARNDMGHYCPGLSLVSQSYPGKG